MDFQAVYFACFGEDYEAASSFFGVSVRTIQRWLSGHTLPPLMAQRLLAIKERGYLPDRYPYDQWRIKGDTVITPFGQSNAFELEQFPAYRSRYLVADRRVDGVNARYERLLSEVDELTAKIDVIKRLRLEIL